MIKVSISNELRAKNPTMQLGVIEANVTNSPTSNDLWTEIENLCSHIANTLTFESIKDQPQIAATRAMYVTCGKEPSRYRPSAESMMRRAVKGLSLYRINTLVDLVNLVSLKSGYSIGGFDADRIVGSSVLASIGTAADEYHGIGRGIINIENMPALRDAKGTFGTPTSDEERTSMCDNTCHLLMVINAYDGGIALQQTIDFATSLLKKYASAEITNSLIIK
ncbi:MAG: hypothetical protein MJ069_00055 [Salinivirgaceae bacterium]|nr:hypothetical protein [Salinivirgaceae bacterium]